MKKVKALVAVCALAIIGLTSASYSMAADSSTMNKDIVTISSGNYSGYGGHNGGGYGGHNGNGNHNGSGGGRGHNGSGSCRR